MLVKHFYKEGNGMKEAIYLRNFTESALIRHADLIEAVMREELGKYLTEHGDQPNGSVTRDNLETKIARLMGTVRASMEAELVQLPEVQEGNDPFYRCVGIRMRILCVQASLVLTGQGNRMKETIECISDRIRAIRVDCPPVSYIGGQLYLPCDTAGHCSQLAKLAEALGDGTSTNNGRTVFTYHAGKLDVMGEVATSREELAMLATKLTVETSGRPHQDADGGD